MEIASLYDIYLQYPNVHTDTRKLEKDVLFFALKGPNFNGNTFAQYALDQGAAYAIVDEKEFVVNERCILVPDVLTTLQELARYHRLQFSIPFIAITGSNGKTTTKELVTAALQQRYITYATKGNLNNHIGVPLTLLQIKKDAEMAVIEMGANHLHEIESYCKIALPDYAIITNCGKAHIEGFGGEEGVRKGKGELYDHIRANKGIIFRNTDLPYLSDMAKGIDRQVTYGTTDAMYTGQPMINNMFLDVAVFNNNENTNIHSNLVGIYNFPNIMTAIAVGLYFNIDLPSIKNAIEAYQPDNSRSQLVEMGDNKIILDAYNANPTSMKAAISNFATSPGLPKHLWIGAMKEMGVDEYKEHKELVDFIQSYNWENVILVGKEFESVSENYTWFENSAMAAAHVATHKPSAAYILIKGSRGSKMELLMDALKG